MKKTDQKAGFSLLFFGFLFLVTEIFDPYILHFPLEMMCLIHRVHIIFVSQRAWFFSFPLLWVIVYNSFHKREMINKLFLHFYFTTLCQLSLSKLIIPAFSDGMR